jgi:hypothetical protein
MTGLKTESWLLSVRMGGHSVRFKLVEERWGRNDEVEDGDSKLVYLMRGFVVFIMFVEPNKPNKLDNPDLRHMLENVTTDFSER